MNNNRKSKWILFSLFGLMILLMLSTQYSARKQISVDSKDDFTRLTNYNPDKILFTDASRNATFQPFEKYYIPPKTVVMWFSEVIPSGWAECNGQNGTPDLRGKFPLAYDNSQSATVNYVGKTGGEERVTLKINEIPSHSHTLTETRDKDCRNGSFSGTDGCWMSGPLSDIQTTTTSVGSSASHENMPPFYVLKFIMKL